MKTILLTLILLNIPSLIYANDFPSVHDDSASQGSFVVVGQEFIMEGDDFILHPDCDSASLQNAINSGASVIRVTTDTYNTRLEIDNQDVTIIGGYSSCTSAANGSGASNQKTVIDAENTNIDLPGITITGNESRHRIELRNIRIEGGQGIPMFNGGGISAFNADVELILRNVELFNNSGIWGGGMSLFAGDVDVTARDLLVRSNMATQGGGGILCSGSNSSITITDSGASALSGIYSNATLDGNGGGVLLQSGCELSTYSGTTNWSASDLRGINYNSAINGFGGGVAVESGAKLFLKGYEYCNSGSCLGNIDHPINIQGNEVAGAPARGGGLYASDSGSTIIVEHGLIRSNTAPGSGGGIYITNQATLNVQQVNRPCWAGLLCNRIDFNRANTGGGVQADASTFVNINHTFFTGNRANNGTAMRFGTGSSGNPLAHINSSVISQNGTGGDTNFSDNGVINSGKDLRITHSTIADNNVNQTVIGQEVSAQIEVINSIIHNSGVDIYQAETQGQLTADCLLVHEDMSFTGNNITVGNPDFINRIGGNYRLANTSPAIDMCAATPVTVSLFDIDGQTRGYNDPAVMNVDGPFDAGADEVFYNDLIFADGFE